MSTIPAHLDAQFRDALQKAEASGAARREREIMAGLGAISALVGGQLPLARPTPSARETNRKAFASALGHAVGRIARSTATVAGRAARRFAAGAKTGYAGVPRAKVVPSTAPPAGTVLASRFKPGAGKLPVVGRALPTAKPIPTASRIQTAKPIQAARSVPIAKPSQKPTGNGSRPYWERGEPPAFESFPKLKPIPVAMRVKAVLKAWDESKHKRDHGKFASKQGAAASGLHQEAHARVVAASAKPAGKPDLYTRVVGRRGGGAVDHAPSLAYADHFERIGKPAVAEFIRTASERASEGGKSNDFGLAREREADTDGSFEVFGHHVQPGDVYLWATGGNVFLRAVGWGSKPGYSSEVEYRLDVPRDSLPEALSALEQDGVVGASEALDKVTGGRPRVRPTQPVSPPASKPAGNDIRSRRAAALLAHPEYQIDLGAEAEEPQGTGSPSPLDVERRRYAEKLADPDDPDITPEERHEAGQWVPPTRNPRNAGRKPLKSKVTASPREQLNRDARESLDSAANNFRGGPPPRAPKRVRDYYGDDHPAVRQWGSMVQERAAELAKVREQENAATNALFDAAEAHGHGQPKPEHAETWEMHLPTAKRVVLRSVARRMGLKTHGAASTEMIREAIRRHVAGTSQKAFVRPPSLTSALMKSWDESKHQRNHGRFAGGKAAKKPKKGHWLRRAALGYGAVAATTAGLSVAGHLVSRHLAKRAQRNMAALAPPKLSHETHAAFGQEAADKMNADARRVLAGPLGAKWRGRVADSRSPEGGRVVSKAWDESKHKRDHGKFAAVGRTASTVARKVGGKVKSAIGLSRPKTAAGKVRQHVGQKLLATAAGLGLTAASAALIGRLGNRLSRTPEETAPSPAPRFPTPAPPANPDANPETGEPTIRPFETDLGIPVQRAAGVAPVTAAPTPATVPSAGTTAAEPGDPHREAAAVAIDRLRKYHADGRKAHASKELGKHTLTALRHIAAGLDAPVKGRSQADLAAAILNHLFPPGSAGGRTPTEGQP